MNTRTPRKLRRIGHILQKACGSIGAQRNKLAGLTGCGERQRARNDGKRGDLLRYSVCHRDGGDTCHHTLVGIRRNGRDGSRSLANCCNQPVGRRSAGCGRTSGANRGHRSIAGGPGNRVGRAVGQILRDRGLAEGPDRGQLAGLARIRYRLRRGQNRKGKQRLGFHSVHCQGCRRRYYTGRSR